MLAGEVMVVTPTRRHWIVLAGHLLLGTVVVVMLLTFVALVTGLDPRHAAPGLRFTAGIAESKATAVFEKRDARLLMMFILSALLGVWAMVRYLAWNSTTFMVTDQRVILEKGLIVHTVWVIPIDVIVDITYQQNIVGRFFGLDVGIVRLQTRRSHVTVGMVARPSLSTAAMIAAYSKQV